MNNAKRKVEAQNANAKLQLLLFLYYTSYANMLREGSLANFLNYHSGTMFSS